MAAEVDDRAAARLRGVPEPGAVRAGVGLARARPQNVSDLAGLDSRDRLQRLRRVDEILEVAGEHAGALDRVEHPLGLRRGSSERLGAEHGLSVLCAQLDGLLVELVREPDHDGVRLRVGDRLLEVRRPLGDVVVRAERRRPLLRAGIDDVHAVAIALPVQRSRVEEADETRPEHAHPVADHRAASSSFVDDVSTEPTRYLAAAKDLLDRLESQSEAVGEAAVLCADAIAADGLVHLFGTGHSRMPVEEMFPRYGSYPGFHPIVELSMTFHTQVVGANGQRQAMFIERVEGLAETILANFELGPPDVMLVFSASGLTAVPIEIAIGAKKRGLPVVAVTSVAQSLAAEPTHSTGTRLLDHADVVLDLCTPPGDAMVVLEGVATPVGPGSTIAAVALVNELKVRTAELLIERGALPPVLSSAAVVGAEESSRLFDAAYAEHARRLAQVLRKT